MIAASLFKLDEYNVKGVIFKATNLKIITDTDNKTSVYVFHTKE